jgi:phosphate transport system permease protein
MSPEVFEAAKSYREMTTPLLCSQRCGDPGGSGLRLLGLAAHHPRMRARNISETFIKALVDGVVAGCDPDHCRHRGSLLFESLQFFQLYPATEFYFSTVWNPQFRGGSDLRFLPLLWGTLYVSFVALSGGRSDRPDDRDLSGRVFGPALRSFAKPAIEVLAGIPTIVYGLFRLITVGPFLRDWIAQPLGLGTSSSSVMTAGLVMGIMLIPFVSSLSDDIINAVPQAMRDGSYGLGATQSETIKQVILPAALPGIVGAILLAASRAIGETMIVVMGAGAAARLDLNPFEAMTTVTVKIVSQLTGDTEFASPRPWWPSPLA